jgi:hypothetical protein
MERLNLRPFLIMFLLCLFAFTCHRAAVQPQKEPSEPQESQVEKTTPPIHDCKKNYTRSGTVYRTWVKYINLDFKNAFDASVLTLQKAGRRIVFTDRESGTISAEMVYGIRHQHSYPINVKIDKADSSLIIYLTFSFTSFPTGPVNLCSFYDEFEKLVKKTPEPTTQKQTPSPPLKTSEPTPSRPPTTSQPPSPQPTPPPPTWKAEVIVPSENLRERPGTNYKIIGKVSKGTILEILEERDNWLRIRLGDRGEAWIWKKSTSEGSKSSTPPPPQQEPKPKPVM